MYETANEKKEHVFPFVLYHSVCMVITGQRFHMEVEEREILRVSLFHEQWFATDNRSSLSLGLLKEDCTRKITSG